MRLLRALLVGLLRLPALFVPLALVAAMAVPIVAVEASSDRAPAGTALANVTHADAISIVLAAVLIAVVFLTFAAITDRRLEGHHRIARARYLLTHAVPRRHVSTYGVELAGEKYSELATWRQWGRRISDHRTFRLAAAASSA